MRSDSKKAKVKKKSTISGGSNLSDGAAKRNIIQVFGTSMSPVALSAILQSLGVSHIQLIGKNVARTPHMYGLPQPAAVVILDDHTRVNRLCFNTPTVVYLCGPKPMLSYCNLGLITTSTEKVIKDSLVFALKNRLPDDWKLVCNEPTHDDFVQESTKPSFMNHVQAALYKILPYDLRKEIQALTLAHLAGKGSKKELFAKLKSNYKLDKLHELMKQPEAEKLRQALILYNKTGSIEQSMALGFESFEILYLSKSQSKV